MSIFPKRSTDAELSSSSSSSSLDGATAGATNASASANGTLTTAANGTTLMNTPPTTTTTASTYTTYSWQNPTQASSSQCQALTAMAVSLTCPLCHQLMRQPAVLPCAHAFCKTCIDHYCSRHSTCPMEDCPHILSMKGDRSGNVNVGGGNRSGGGTTSGYSMVSSDMISATESLRKMDEALRKAPAYWWRDDGYRGEGIGEGIGGDDNGGGGGGGGERGIVEPAVRNDENHIETKKAEEEEEEAKAEDVTSHHASTSSSSQEHISRMRNDNTVDHETISSAGKKRERAGNMREEGVFENPAIMIGNMSALSTPERTNTVGEVPLATLDKENNEDTAAAATTTTLAQPRSNFLDKILKTPQPKPPQVPESANDGTPTDGDQQQVEREQASSSSSVVARSTPSTHGSLINFLRMGRKKLRLSLDGSIGSGKSHS